MTHHPCCFPNTLTRGLPCCWEQPCCIHLDIPPRSETVPGNQMVLSKCLYLSNGKERFEGDKVEMMSFSSTMSGNHSALDECHWCDHNDVWKSNKTAVRSHMNRAYRCNEQPLSGAGPQQHRRKLSFPLSALQQTNPTWETSEKEWLSSP